MIGSMPIITPPFKAAAVTASANGGGDASTYEFSGLSFGKPSARRIIIIAGAGADGDPSRTVTSVTIGGVAATIDVQSGLTSNSVNGKAFIAHAAVPDGATGDVVVTYNGTVRACSVGVIRAVNLHSATPFDTENVNSTLSMSIDVPHKGFVVAAASVVGGSFIDWNTGAEIIEGNDGAVYSSMFSGIQAAQTGKSITVSSDSGGGSNSKACCASFG